MSIATRRRYAKNPSSNNPLPNGCVFYAPLWHPNCHGSTFKSIDPFGHSCTRTGGVMDGDGFTADGDDKIATPHHASFSFAKTSKFSLLAYVKATNTNGLQYIVDKYASSVGYLMALYTAAPGENRLIFQVQSASAIYKYKYGDTDMAGGAWFQVAITNSGAGTLAGMLLYVNGADDGGTTDEAGALGDITNAEGLEIGDALTGSIGEVWGYDRTLSPVEVAYHYNVTKWRY